MAEVLPTRAHERSRLANLVEFKRWIRTFGDQAEVLRPESLRREMKAELLTAARQYE